MDIKQAVLETKHHQVFVSVFLCFQCCNTNSPVLAAAADNTEEHSPAASNQPKLRLTHSWNVDNSDGLGDVPSLAAPPHEDGDGEGPPKFGKRRPGRGGKDDGPHPEGRGGGGRRPPRPGRGGPERDGKDDLVSSLVGPAPEGMGGESLHVWGIIRNLKNVVFVYELAP